MNKATIIGVLCGVSLVLFSIFHIQVPRKLPGHHGERTSQGDTVEVNATPGTTPGTSSARPSLPSSPATQSSVVVSPAYADVLKEPWRQLSMDQLASLPPLDAALEKALIDRCSSISSPTNAAGLFTVLAYHGHDAAFEFLANTLTNRYRDRQLSLKEKLVLLRLPCDMGLLARHNDQAFLFLRQGLNPEFWRENFGCLSDDPDGSIGMLVAMALRGIGTSGRPEAASILFEQRKPGSDVMRLGLQGALMDAAFWLWLALTEGERFYQGAVSMTGEQVMSRFSAWQERTSEGQDWKRWFESAEPQRLHPVQQ